MAEQQVGPFVLLEKLGSGGMGVVYRARYTKTGQIVALKVLPAVFSEDEKRVARFDRELAILKKLKHPNIVQCYGGGKLEERRFYAMELLSDGSLAMLLKNHGPLPWEQVIEFGCQICAGLEYAHSQGIIHRDLKPGNLLLTKERTLKICDFGVARDMAATGLTAPGRTVGTAEYMAPEQIRGEPPVSHRTDLYSLGCVLYEMLTGHPPFRAESSAEMYYQHLEKPPRRVATEALDCPVWLDTLILQLLEKNSDKRPWDASAVEQALREVQQKVTDRVSMAQHAVSGQPTALNVTSDAVDAVKLLKTKKKKRSKGPFYEKTWFLAACLLLVISGVAWALWPLNEEQLFRRAEPLMASNDPSDWMRAETEFLTALQQRFPQGKYALQVQAYIDKIEMDRAENRLRTNNRLGREPTSEGERLYAQARKFEQFGDRVSASEKYRSMVNLLKDNSANRPFVNLARRQIADIEQSGGVKEDRQKIIADALDRAADSYQKGNVMEARKTWTSIVTLYATNRELRPQVKIARKKLNDKDEDAADKDADEAAAERSSQPIAGEPQ